MTARAPDHRTLRAKDVEQLFCDETEHQDEDGTTYTYNLQALLKGSHRRIKLIGDLEKPEQALYLEQRLEGFMGIEDERVSGELRK